MEFSENLTFYRGDDFFKVVKIYDTFIDIEHTINGVQGSTNKINTVKMLIKIIKEKWKIKNELDGKEKIQIFEDIHRIINERYSQTTPK